MLNKTLILLVLLTGCKVQDGDNTAESCTSAAGCYDEYLACDETIYYDTHESKTFNVACNNTNYYFAQSFELQRKEKLSSFTIALQSSGSPEGEVYMELRADCSGSPCSATIATSSSVDMDEISTTASNNDLTFTFSDPQDLDRNTTYWAVVYIPLDGQATPNIYQKSDNSDLYSAGTFKTSNNDGASWNDGLSNYDAYLQINVCE